MRKILERFAVGGCLVMAAGGGLAVELMTAMAAAKSSCRGSAADGSVLLPNQWSLRPAGRQVALGDFPVNIAVHPDGGIAAVLHCGHGPHEIVVVDLKEGEGGIAHGYS